MYQMERKIGATLETKKGKGGIIQSQTSIDKWVIHTPANKLASNSSVCELDNTRKIMIKRQQQFEVIKK